MTVVKKITQPGNNLISTLGGQISIDEGRGRMVIYDPVLGREINIVDKDGYTLTDGEVTTQIEAGKFVQNDGTNDRIYLGNE